MRTFFVDGSCRKNPGPGGFGVVGIEGNNIFYKYNEQTKENEVTTNNREELKAILHIFKKAVQDYRFETVIVHSDSAYCVNMINDWIWKWANNNWQNSKKQEVENIDLVKQLYNYLTIEFFPCQVVKINGHCGNVGNELADALATNDETKYQKFLTQHELKEHFIVKLENL